MAAEEHRAIATFVEIAVLVSLGAMIARALPPPLELDPKKTRKETTKVLEKARRKKKKSVWKKREEKSAMSKGMPRNNNRTVGREGDCREYRYARARSNVSFSSKTLLL